jgi:hypothetical protein
VAVLSVEIKGQVLSIDTKERWSYFDRFCITKKRNCHSLLDRKSHETQKEIPDHPESFREGDSGARDGKNWFGKM